MKIEFEIDARSLENFFQGKEVKVRSGPFSGRWVKILGEEENVLFSTDFWGQVWVIKNIMKK